MTAREAAGAREHRRRAEGEAAKPQEAGGATVEANEPLSRRRAEGTAAELPARIALLRSLLHGRQDASARWEDGGRHGSAPVALDAGHRRRGELPALDDRAMARRLAGAQRIGIDPLSPDGGFWLLAARIDPPAWGGRQARNSHPRLRGHGLPALAAMDWRRRRAHRALGFEVGEG